MVTDDSKSIVLFDGVCNLCNGFVDFMIKRDPDGRFLYGALQNEKSQALLEKYGETIEGDMTSVILIQNGKIYKKSVAVQKILDQLGTGWSSLSTFMKWTPPSFSDGMYNFIAQRRYKILGKRDTCRIPTKEESNRFL
jgi:predicted DCC family thiol-disulfide oxidoreductase YuxK